MFSKNKDDKHKSLLSKHKLSAFNAKEGRRGGRKKPKKSEILRQMLLTLHMGQMNLELFS